MLRERKGKEWKERDKKLELKRQEGIKEGKNQRKLYESKIGKADYKSNYKKFYKN